MSTFETNERLPQNAKSQGIQESAGNQRSLKASESMKLVSLQETIGITSCVGIVVGTIIGSGIFISPKGVLLGTGSVGLTIIVWLLCGCYSFIGSWAFAELGLLIPSSGAQYIYFLESFAPKRKEKKPFFGPLVAFVYIWQQMLFARPAGLAVQSLAIANYLTKLFSLNCIRVYDHQTDETSIKLIAISVIALMTSINTYSNKVSTRFINILTALKLFALLTIFIGGLVKFAQGTNESLNTGFEGTQFQFQGIALAFYSGLWAYAGWDNLNMVAKEIKDPEKNLPKALAISCSLVTVTYIITNIAYFVVMSKNEFLASEAVAVDFSYKLLGNFGSAAMVLFVVSSIFGSTTGGMFTSIRAVYAAAKEGHLLDIFSYLNIRHMTPTPALIFTSGLSIFAITQSSILELIFLLGFFEACFLFILMVALLVLRKTKKDVKRPVKAPLFVPVIMMLSSLFLLLMPLISNPKMEYLYVLLLLFVGVVVYVPFIYYELKLPGLDKIRRFVQLILEVCPPEDQEIKN